jgi:CubicO group peptidase (beta-lactamase class C family)
MPTASPALPLATPASAGLDAAVLDGELSDLLGANKTGAAALVVNGQLVWEKYWAPFGPDSRFDTMSIGKAYAAAAIGLLVDDGKLSVEDPACKFLPEWAPRSDPRNRITIRHLLTMTSGLKLDYETFCTYPDTTAKALTWPQDHAPGEVWCYEQATSQALCPIIVRLSGKQPIDFLQDRILGPIGASAVTWKRDADGNCLTYRSVNTSARDLCRFGWFLHQQGKWNGKQLLGRDFAARMVRRDLLVEKARTDPRQDDFRRRNYAWQMFCNADGVWEGVGRRCFAPLGSAGNMCLVDVDKNFVFARLSTPEDVTDAKDYWSKLDVTDKGTSLAWRTVLKAFR